MSLAPSWFASNWGLPDWSETCKEGHSCLWLGPKVGFDTSGCLLLDEPPQCCGIAPEFPDHQIGEGIESVANLEELGIVEVGFVEEGTAVDEGEHGKCERGPRP